MNELCKKCGGDGVLEYDDGRREAECPTCNGWGYVPSNQDDSNDRVLKEIAIAEGEREGYVSLHRVRCAYLETIAEKSDKIRREAEGYANEIKRLKEENRQLKADKEALAEWVDRVCYMQAKNYGKGFITHITLIGLCEIGRHLLAKHTEEKK